MASNRHNVAVFYLRTVGEITVPVSAGVTGRQQIRKGEGEERKAETMRGVELFLYTCSSVCFGEWNALFLFSIHIISLSFDSFCFLFIYVTLYSSLIYLPSFFLSSFIVHLVRFLSAIPSSLSSFLLSPFLIPWVLHRLFLSPHSFLSCPIL
ncbi:uncharacterized protein C8R40DRAFT_87963 [Lentinula edodes]|uniref:uncharacterized protein n=1 Tax=Lentinula edodes TaxID=5353 RepID=UPI001E8D42F3|nr:uncharacterized protein C8R40DRAFT_87963 [Lentinula edodes]KAH7877023.1 hypothetical protein C8R40DRAFT_87963 [Lentinula edodes]